MWVFSLARSFFLGKRYIREVEVKRYSGPSNICPSAPRTKSGECVAFVRYGDFWICYKARAESRWQSSSSRFRQMELGLLGTLILNCKNCHRDFEISGLETKLVIP